MHLKCDELKQAYACEPNTFELQNTKIHENELTNSKSEALRICNIRIINFYVKCINALS